MLTKDLTKDTMDKFMTEWPEGPRRTVQRMVHKYGTPDEATNSMFIWYNNGPWKKTVISRNDEI